MQFSTSDPLNFSDTPADRNYIASVMNIANNILGNIRLPLYGSSVPIGYPNDPNGETHISESGFQFAFDPETDIEFVADPIGWSNDNDYFDDYLPSNYGQDDSNFDIFILGTAATISGYGPPNYNLYYSWWDNIQNASPEQNSSDIYTNAMNVVHEFGHSFGLNHSWNCSFSDIQPMHCSGGGGSCGHACQAYCNPQEDSRCLSNIMSYAAVAKWNLTPLQIGRMHQRAFLASNTKFLVHENNSTEDIHIYDQVQWEISHIVNGDVIIHSGGELTINCKVIMPPNGQIKVEKGGRLIVDGGHITIASPLHGEYWNGIWAEGNPSERQNNNLQQAYVRLENDALIEYANTGVLVKGGARLESNNCTIKNCRYGVYFHPYTFPGIPWLNLSRFIKTNFQLTDDHILDVQPFVSLNGVGNINFTDCAFEDLRTPSEDFPTHFSNFQSIGISSLNSNFIIKGGSLFSQLYLGISAGNNGSIKNFSIKNTAFQHCFGGIVNRGVMNATITDNTFLIGDYDRTPINPKQSDAPGIEWDGFGISLQSASGFDVSGNDFSGNFNVSSKLKNTLGIYTSESGGAANKINNNSFSDLIIGNYAAGVNYSSIPILSGLEYYCNQNTDGGGIGASYDFYVENSGGISPLQGNPDKPTGNTFRGGGLALGNDFRNATDADLLSYFYFGQAPHVPENFINIIPFGLDFPNECIEDDGGGDKPSLDVIIKLRENFQTARLAYEDSRNQYLSLLDNGDAQDLKATVENTTSANLVQTFTLLQQLSPYLSAEVLKKVAEHPLIIKDELINLAIVNPESLKKAGLIDKIAAEKALDASEIDQLKETAKTVHTVRSTLEQELHDNYAEMQYTGHRLLRISMAAEEVDESAILEQLKLQEDLISDYAQAELHWEMGERTTAWDLLNDINQYQLTTTALIDQHNAYENIKSLHELILNGGRNWDQLEMDEVTQLQTIANIESGLGSVQARQVLNSYYNFNYLKLPSLPASLQIDENGTQNLQSHTGNAFSPVLNQPTKQKKVAFYIAPNPAKQKVYFSFIWPDSEDMTTYADFKVIDIRGREVFSERIFNGQSGLTWQPENYLQQGVYYCIFQMPGHNFQPQKLILIK